MPIAKLTRLMREMGVWSPAGAVGLSAAIAKHGVNLMMLLEFAERLYGEGTALIDDAGEYSYAELRKTSEDIADNLEAKYSVGRGQKVAFLCCNQAAMVTAIFAVSRLGADIYLLNADMGHSQLGTLLQRHKFDLLIHDCNSRELADLFPEHEASFVHMQECASRNSNTPVIRKPKRMAAGRLVLLTGGTTGVPKAVTHQPSLFNYIDPYLGLLTKLKLTRHNNVLIATPLYHGYGFAILLSFLALGKTVVMSRGFSAERMSTLIRTHAVEVITVVPLMAERLLAQGADNLRSVKCIASGGAPLHPRVIRNIEAALGPVLFNLYGTSETGLTCIATPEELALSPGTVGRKICGGRLKLLDPEGNETAPGESGQICTINSWSMASRRTKWIGTRDLGYVDMHGLLHVCGRIDDMIISGGENVHPAELESLLRTHPHVRETAVIGVSDEQFGQRLCAVIEPLSDTLTAEEIRTWLEGRAARYHMPKRIILRPIPYTALGKPDRRRLRVELQ